LIIKVLSYFNKIKFISKLLVHMQQQVTLHALTKASLLRYSYY